MHNIFKNIQLSHLGCSGLISTHKDRFWDKIIHQIRDHFISFFIAATWILFQTGEGGGEVNIYMKHYSSSHNEETYEPGGEGGHSRTWRWSGTSTLLTPVFDIFQCHWVLLLCPTRSYWPPLSAEKICLSLSHSVPEIIWPKVGQFFHKNLSFDTFEAICTTFLLDFQSCWPPFSLLLDIFDSSFLKNLRSSWIHFFHCVLDHPPPKIWWSAPSSPTCLWDDYLQLLI